MPDGHDEPRQLFTLDEANQRLPLVRAIVRDIVTLFQDLHDRRERLNDLRSQNSDEVEQMERDLERDIETLESYVVELKQLGVALKDPLLGLVDFRTLADGREAYLCWKLGEDEISWWRELDSGSSDRRPIVELEDPVPTPSSGGDDTGTAST